MGVDEGLPDYCRDFDGDKAALRIEIILSAFVRVLFSPTVYLLSLRKDSRSTITTATARLTEGYQKLNTRFYVLVGFLLDSTWHVLRRILPTFANPPPNPAKVRPGLTSLPLLNIMSAPNSNGGADLMIIHRVGPSRK